MKFRDMDENARDRIDEYVRYRWNHLESIRSSLEDHAIKFLFATNAGGAATLLTFIGSTGFIPTTSVISLAIFTAGLFLTGLGIAFGLKRIAKLQKTWNNDSAEMFEGKIEWANVIENDKNRQKIWSPGELLAWSSFVFWVIGTACGFSSFLLYINKQNINKQNEPLTSAKQSRNTAQGSTTHWEEKHGANPTQRTLHAARQTGATEIGTRP